MPNDIAHECHEGEGVDAQVMHGYQSVWMSHWTHTNYKSSTTAARNRLLNRCEVKEIKEDSDAEPRDLLCHRRSEVAIDGYVHAGATGEADRDTRVSFSNEMGPGKPKKASLDSKSFPIFRKKNDGISSLKRERNGVSHGKDWKFETESSSGDDNVSLYRTGSHLPSTSAHAPPRTETLVREYQLLSKGISPTPLLMKSPRPVEQNNLAVSTSLWNGFVKSASDKVPNGRDKGKNLVPPSTPGQHEVYQSSYKLASQEHFTSTKYHSYSLLIREKKKSNLLDPQRFSFPRRIQGDDAHLPHDTTAGCDGYSTANAETMKIYTSIDSIEESSRDHPKMSQRTHHFLMSKKAVVNLSERGQFFREAIPPTKFKGNACNEMIDSSPSISDYDLEGVKLEARGSSKKSEGEENVQDLNSPTSLKNESSAETDTMDIDALHKNHLPGNVPLRTNKCSEDSQNSPTSQVAITSVGEKNKGKLVYAALPDINQEPPEVLTMASPLALASPVVDRETSTSRTDSLDVEHLLSHADEHARSKSGNSSLGPDPSSRWVKRLKLCSSRSAHGTRSATIGETSLHEKVDNVFSKMKGSKTSLEPKIACHAEEQMVPDLCATVLTNGKSSSTKANKTAEIALSHPWIQRWCHNHDISPQKRHELAEFREPKSSNTPKEFQKKQFPSIAAMAMMGKAMNSLNPCVLMKKGPVVVWNM